MTDFVRLKSKHADLIPPHKTFECGPGWEQVLDKYFDAVGRALPPRAKLRLDGVYQKSGSLRIDATPEGEVADDLRLALDKAEIIAESRSYRVCEICGKPGHLREKHRRLFVACEAHAGGAEPLPPDEGVVQMDGIFYAYDEGLDDLVDAQTESEPSR